MKTRTKLTLAVVAAIALIGLSVLASMLSHGLSARDQPTAIEAVLARSMRLLAMPRSARTAKNPVPLSDEVLSEGRAHFADHCALCHGNDGAGRTGIGQNLYPKAPDMRSDQTQSLSDGEIFYVIKDGIRLTGMPAWGANTAQEDRETWSLVHFIRHLPHITREEIEQMNRLNPRSPRDSAEEDEEMRFLEGEDVPAPTQEHHH